MFHGYKGQGDMLFICLASSDHLVPLNLKPLSYITGSCILGASLHPEREVWKENEVRGAPGWLTRFLREIYFWQWDESPCLVTAQRLHLAVEEICLGTHSQQIRGNAKTTMRCAHEFSRA